MLTVDDMFAMGQMGLFPWDSDEDEDEEDETLQYDNHPLIR